NCPTLEFTPASLPSTSVGSVYNQTITPSGGTAPFSFNVTGLPNGLTANATSTSVTITGTPTIAGSSNVQVTASDGYSCPINQTYTLTVWSYSVQDNTSGDYLLFNSTGEYYYRRCSSGLTLSGTGAVSTVGCTVRMTVNNSTQRITVSLDKCKLT